MPNKTAAPKSAKAAIYWEIVTGEIGDIVTAFRVDENDPDKLMRGRVMRHGISCMPAYSRASLPPLSWPASQVAGVAEPACFHPRSCVRCDRAGIACGRHYRGDAGHERCVGGHA